MQSLRTPLRECGTVEVYRRTQAGRWELLEGRPGDFVELRSLGISLDVAAVYANPLAPPA